MQTQPHGSQTGLIKYQGGKLVTKVGKSGRAGSDAASNTLMQADRQ